MKNKGISKEVLFLLKLITIFSFIFFSVVEILEFYFFNRQGYQNIPKFLYFFIHFDIFLFFPITIFLLVKYEDKKNNIKKENNILNIASFSGTKKTDVTLLEKVLQGHQYKNIAFETKRAEGTVRNRLNKLYDILGVYDRVHFVSLYYGYEIIFKTEKICL